MSTERIDQLHEKASECYLNGDYEGALAAWRDVLGLDPADEQALGGVRLASQFVEHASPAFAEDTSGIDRELDEGLRVLDGLGASTLLRPDAADGASDRKPEPRREPDPEPEAELEFESESESEPELELVEDANAEQLLQGWDMPAESPSEGGSFGLDPVARSSPAAAPGMSAAAAELSRRVNDLLVQARAKDESGERDEALAILARLSILDEDNAEAAALRSKLEAEGDSSLDRVEQAIIEGVAALEAERFDEAEKYLREALAIVPGHREAQHYLEKVAERRGDGGEDLLTIGDSESAPIEVALHPPTVMETEARQASPSSTKTPPPKAAPNRTAPAPRAFRLTLPPPKVLILAGVGVAVLASAGIGLFLLGGRAESEPAAQQSAPPQPRPKRPPKASPPADSGTSAPAPAVPATPEDAAKMLASSLAKGRSLMASGDFGGAVIAFNDALAVDPKNVEARAGFEDAGDRYKAFKAQREALNTIALAFRDGEYTSGLRLAYRLPPTVSQSYTDAVKVTGWYNLALVALRAGECREAVSHLDEALQIAPQDTEAKQLRELASRYVDAVKDRAFLSRVEALMFRTLPAS